MSVWKQYLGGNIGHWQRAYYEEQVSDIFMPITEAHDQS